MSFQHAAVSKGLMIGCAATSIVASIFDVKYYLHLQLFPHLTRHHQYWRLLVHHFAFSNSSELLLTELLLYNVAVPVERVFGSSKFSAFCFSSLIASTIMEFGSLLLLNRLGLNVLPSGPFTLVFGILYQFSRLIPRAYTFRIFGLTVTNKVFTYILALQLAISQPPGSIVASLIGIVSGQLYRSDVLGLKTFRLPLTVRRLAKRYLVPLVGSTKPPRLSNRALPDDVRRPRRTALGPSQEAAEVATTGQAPPADQETQTQGRPGQQESGGGSTGQSMVREWVDELTGRTERAAAGLRVPTENEIGQLANMFPDLRREDIVGALQRSPNIEAAVDTLLSSNT